MNQTSPAPLVSVIILNYNGAQWIERAASVSLAAQSCFSKIEVIVTADNQSSDGSRTRWRKRC